LHEEDAAALLGEGFAGVIERDGWAPYRKFVHATHQTCLAHLLRRCGELISDADRGQAKTPSPRRSSATGLGASYAASGCDVLCPA
jgi:Transposase IS66 family